MFTYTTMNPVMVGWDPSTQNGDSIIALANVYETLTIYNAATETIDPLLATDWSTSPDALTWTFRLQPNVYFHTGRLMTAQAVKASIERTIKLNQGAAYIWSAVKSITAPNSSTVVFHLKYATPLDIVASAGYAAYVFDTKASGDEPLHEWFEAGHEAGTGPYTVQTWRPGQEDELSLIAFPEYWRGWSDAHYQQVEFRVVTQDTTAVQLLTSGQVSFVRQMSPSLWESLKTNPQIQLLSVPLWMNLIGQMNTTSGPLADPTVRQAIAYAIDYEGIVTALKGAALPAGSLVPPGLWGHFEDLNYEYDPTKAAQLLESAGYGPGGKPMELLLTHAQGNSNQAVVSSIMKSNLAQLNVDLRSQALVWQTQWEKGQSSDLSKRQDIFIEYWWPDYGDPSSWFASLLHSEETVVFNLSYYSNRQMDEMMERAAELTSTNREQATALYREIQILAKEEAPVLLLYDVVGQYSALKSVGNLQMNPAYANVVFVYELEPLPL